jgi:hypothetical protein
MVALMTDRLAALLDRLADVAYPALRERYRADCCVAAAAILKRVFEVYGFKSEVIPVAVEIYNAQMDKLLRQGTRLPEDRERREMFFDLTGAWSVGLMPSGPAPLAINDQRGGGFGGHLILHVEDCLIDATIKQADRPHKQIVLPELVVTEAAHLVSDGVMHLRVNDCAVVYRRIDDHSYRSAPDWRRRTTPFPETVRTILAKIRGGTNEASRQAVEANR